MLIKEYHILLPMSLDEYQVAQLYMIQVRTAGGLYWNRASWWSEARIRRPQGDSSAGFPPPPTHTPVPLVDSVAQKRKTDILWIY